MQDVDTLFSINRISRKAMWRAYLVAFLALLVIITGSHILAERMAVNQEQHAGIINLAGKQRMLDQRIAGRIAQRIAQRIAGRIETAARGPMPRLGVIGDGVIRHFAATCLRGIRDHDVLGRFGGEKFAILLPETTIEDAAMVAERVRAMLEAAPAKAQAEGDGETLSLPITASLGGAERAPAETTPHALIERADAALYDAKEGGRNRVCLAAPGPDVRGSA